MTRLSGGFRGCRTAPVLMFVAALVFAGCADNVDVRTGLTITDVVTGYFDMGVVGGKNKLVPSVAFQVKNAVNETVKSVQFNAVFRVVDDEQELGSAFVRGIDTSGLEAGKST